MNTISNRTFLACSFPSLLLRTAAILMVLPAAARAQWQTVQTVPPTSLQWVSYTPPPNGPHPGAWGMPHQWPGGGTSVTIRHEIGLHNTRYDVGAPIGTPYIEPFPGGAPLPPPGPLDFLSPHTAGFLQLSSLNIEPGGWLMPSVGELAFDGISTWSGGAIGNPVNHNGLIHNQGQLSVTGPFVLTRNGSRGMQNTEHIAISSTFGIQAGGFLTNLSGGPQETSVAEIVLTTPGASIANADGGAFIENYGVLRKTGSGTASISIGINNYADSTRNRAGTVAVDEGTLILNGQFANHTFKGLKAEIAPGALLVVERPVVMESGDTTVTGGGVLRFQPIPGTFIGVPNGPAAATLSAPEGKLEHAGGDLRYLINKGSINVTAPSIWRNMRNEGHARLLADLNVAGSLQNGTPASHTAVLDLVGNAGLTGHPVGYSLHNYGVLRKIGPGTSLIPIQSSHYGSADPLSGRIEVLEGTLQAGSVPNNDFPPVRFDNGGSVRVASGAVFDLRARTELNGGTLTVSGSGKCYLNPGSNLINQTPLNPATINAAPGTFELRGGELYAPMINAGELYITAPTTIPHSTFEVFNGITNAGTLRCTATSAGATGGSISLGPITGIICPATSVISLDIAGRPAQRDQWARIFQQFTQANIAYGGTLRVNFANFTPVSGDRWRVIQNESAVVNTGDFAKVEFTNVPAGFVPVSQKSDSGYEVGLDAAPTPVTYDTWAAAQNFTTPASGAFDVDSDGDGIDNGLECALGTDPISTASTPAITTVPLDSGGDHFLAAEFTRPGGADRPTDIQWIGERSDALGGWTSAGVVVEYGPLDAQGKETIIVRLAEPMEDNSQAFIRLKLQKL